MAESGSWIARYFRALSVRFCQELTLGALKPTSDHFSMYWSKIRVAVSRILDISSDFFDFGTLGEPWPLLIVFGSFDSITVR